jgi:hypothetical protein
MSTVYVLGAGASKHVGYPLASTMGVEILAWMSSHERYRDTAESIREMFGDAPNIEDVISKLEDVIILLEGSDKFDDRVRRTTAAHQRAKIGEVIPIWFTEIHTNTAPAYQQFAEKVVEPGDVIITFNYDDSLERELKRVAKWDISKGYAFQIGPLQTRSEVIVLKLHGSMNWLVSIFNGITSGSFAIGGYSSLGELPCVATDYLRYLGYDEMLGTFPGGGAFPSLILPGRVKVFHFGTSFGAEHKEFFDTLWFQAAAALKRAEKLVLCGYSLLPVDQRACDLLLGVPSKDTHITVVSGSDGQRISKQFRDAGIENVECYENGYFETWVAESTARALRRASST